ncbi:MAG: 2-oxoglutarate dehydrogenase complex dihydrolipoyllysine-residue succinyltransferase, partial [Pseudomonadales bacterium]
MMIDIKAPTFPESVADGEVGTWHYQPGDSVQRDEILVEIETDKVVLEVVAPADGTLKEILKEEGDTVLAEEVLGHFEEGEVADSAEDSGDGGEAKSSDNKESATKASAPKKEQEAETEESEQPDEPLASPAARKLAEENRLDLADISGSGKDGRVTKEDVLKAVAKQTSEPETNKQSSARESEAKTEVDDAIPEAPLSAEERVEKRVPMSRLRASIARRLVEVQQTAAMLTTFNEVDMQSVMDLRERYKDEFEKSHDGVRLGFMSFFVRASIEALKRFPGVNASIDETDIVYHGYQDIGVAVGSPRGLVVPVLRDADSLTLAEIENQIRSYSVKARDGKLSIDDMTGGTFTISNGGIFGSLLSTPILNPPQTAILGMHKIQERPMAIDGKVEIRPMMYLALTYDHRLIDGQEAVRFLVTIKELLEDP